MKKVSKKFYCNKNVPYTYSVQLKSSLMYEILLRQFASLVSEFYKLIEKEGWTIKKGKKHYKYVHPDFDYFIPVGRHPSKEIPKGTLEKMLKDAGLKK